MTENFGLLYTQLNMDLTCNFEYTIECIILCTTDCTIECTILCTIECTILCTIECTFECTRNVLRIIYVSREIISFSLLLASLSLSLCVDLQRSRIEKWSVLKISIFDFFWTWDLGWDLDWDLGWDLSTYCHGELGDYFIQGCSKRNVLRERML